MSAGMTSTRPIRLTLVAAVLALPLFFGVSASLAAEEAENSMQVQGQSEGQSVKTLTPEERDRIAQEHQQQIRGARDDAAQQRQSARDRINQRRMETLPESGAGKSSARPGPGPATAE